MASAAITVVVITRNRAAALRAALEKMVALPERPQIIVVDNASSDDTRQVLATAAPQVKAIHLAANAGAAGRNAGVAAAATPYVAFSDDDSWWAPGALRRAAGYLDAHPRLGLLAARVLVGVDERLDPACLTMARSPLARARDLPGPSVLGFIACGAVVRAEAFLQAGGFHAHFGVGGEETLLALDLASAGWGLAYCEDVVSLHHPEPSAPRPDRQARLVRNRLWTAWLRWPASAALAATAGVVGQAMRNRDTRRGLLEAVRGLPWIWRQRIPVDARLERDVSQVLRPDFAS
jgi:GT2 family glycosyltransferase